MSNRETLDYDPVDALIEQGRRELTDGKIDKARWCFEEVLRRRPDEPRALLGLSYAARKSERPPGMDEASEAERRDKLADAASVLSVDVEVVVLVREKRYSEALLKLRAELSKRPEDRALLRSIAHLEQHINRPSAHPVPSTSESPAAPALLPQQPAIPKLRAVTIGEPAKEVAVETKAVETKAVETKAVETKAVETKAVETKAVETKAVETKAAVKVVSKDEEKAKADPIVVDAVPLAPSLPAHDVEAEATVPFELMKVVSMRPSSAEEQSVVVSDEALDGEARIEDFTSSGGFRMADEDPSGPALGSLPQAPMVPSTKKSGGGATWWIFALLAIAALALALALR
ncbi:MAG: hypothetical protein ACI9KE_006011 [Polyangiales bacterium]|jgi:hypothetical protein